MDNVDIRKPIEYRAEVDSLEELQQRRRELVGTEGKPGRWAVLGAKFKGGSGVASADTLRKRHRAGIMCMISQEKFGDVAKDRVESMLERLANADERHIKFCEELMNEFAEFLVLDNTKAEIEEKIQSREVELRAYTAEARLQS